MHKKTVLLTACIVSLSFGLLFLFAYTHQMGVSFFNLGQGGQEAAVWYANTNQKIKHIYFGPSPRSEDTKKLFDQSRDALWAKLAGPKSFDGIEIHMLSLDNVGISVEKSPDYINAVTLSDAEILRIKKLQDTYALRVVVPAGVMLTHYCHESDIKQLAKNAATDEMKIFSRLYKAGVRIDEFTVDGAFLDLMNGPDKGADEGSHASCFKQGRIFTNTQVAETVAAYLNELVSQGKTQRESYIASIRGNTSEVYAPAITLVENVPNWQIDDFYEMHYGQTPMSLEGSYNDIIAEFKKTNYPPINTILIDYPYSYISGKEIFTKASSRTDYSNCKKGVMCTKISPAESFKGKITGLYRLTHDLRGAPNLSFYINTGDLYSDGKGNPLCATAKGDNWFSVKAIPLVVYAQNRCFSGEWPFDGSATRVWNKSTVDTKIEADNDQAERDKKYFEETRMYYNLVTKGLPNGIVVDNLYVTSWHTNPRYGAVQGLKMQQVISESRY